MFNYKEYRIFLSCGKTDMRKSINGLCDIVQFRFQLDPREKMIFVFCNQARNRMKLLVWEDNGFWLHYKSSERDEKGGTIYKDICNPITKEFREEFYGNILEAFEKVKEQENGKIVAGEKEEMPAFSVKVTSFEREGSNIRGLARIYFEDSFVVNNVSVLQGKDEVFVAIPSYKTNQKDEHGKATYQDVCYPVTKEFREKLYGEVIREYKDVKEKSMEQAKDEEQQAQVSYKPERDTPFR